MRQLAGTITFIILLLNGQVLAVNSSLKTADAVEREHFVYYFDNPSYINTADKVLLDVRDRLSRLVNDTLPYKPSVYIVEDIVHFNDLIRGKFPDWGAAAAFPERRLIAIKSPDKFNIQHSLEELLAHEYSHLVVAHKTGFKSAPRWFDEGMAMYISMEWSWSDNLAMSKAAVFGQFINLKAIEKVNRFNASKAHVAYAQSYLAIKYLIDNYGINSLQVFLDEISKGASISKALLNATGSNYIEFESDYKEELNKRFNIISLFMDTMFFWLGLAILVIVGAFLKYKKRRQYYKKWDEEERLQSTDFDYGDMEHPEKIDDEDEPWRE